jgi:flagellar hook-associated protein 3 FlgL
MRITNKMITTRYIRSLNTLTSDLNKYSTQIESGRAFSKSSENTAAAVKAYQLRKDLSKIEGYQSNIAHAQSSLSNSETVLMNIEDLVLEAKDKIRSANTASASADERKIVATELKNLQEQLLQALNSNSSGSYYFGGTNTDTAPFSVGTDGKLVYNGISLSTTDPAEQAILESYKDDSLYVDIGMGITLIDDPEDTAVPPRKIPDPKSVFQYSLAGVNIVGSGTTTIDGVEVSNNLYDLLGSIASGLESSSYTYGSVDALYGKFDEASMEIVYNLTEVGAKTSYLKFMEDRYDTQTLSMQERQLEVEGADPAYTIILFKSQQVAYNAALQMGTKIIQPSIFDFMS